MSDDFFDSLPPARLIIRHPAPPEPGDYHACCDHAHGYCAEQRDNVFPSTTR